MSATKATSAPDAGGGPVDDGATIAGRLAAVRASIRDAAVAADREPGTVRLVAVGKTWPLARIEEAASAGQTDFGENRARELRDKAAARPDLTWHFVGRLQTNKVKYVVGTCALVHAVDRVDLAEALAARAVRDGVVQDVLVQVNADADPAKAGVTPRDTPELVARTAGLAGLRVRGLMTMPAQDGDPVPAFRTLRELRDDLRGDFPGLVELSMGMTRDYRTAIGEGATIVRVGEAIFGPRTSA